jgi:hypothetical protein
MFINIIRGFVNTIRWNNTRTTNDIKNISYIMNTIMIGLR